MPVKAARQTPGSSAAHCATRTTSTRTAGRRQGNSTERTLARRQKCCTPKQCMQLGRVQQKNACMRTTTKNVHCQHADACVHVRTRPPLHAPAPAPAPAPPRLAAFTRAARDPSCAAPAWTGGAACAPARRPPCPGRRTRRRHSQPPVLVLAASAARATAAAAATTQNAAHSSSSGSSECGG